MNQHDPLVLHTFYGWLAYALFLTYHLNACEQISLGPHAHLSSWCVWYGLMTWSSLLMFKYLGKFIWKITCKAPLWFSKVLPKPYDEFSWKAFPHMQLAFSLSFVKLLRPIVRFISYSCDQNHVYVHSHAILPHWKIASTSIHTLNKTPCHNMTLFL